jgi:glucose-6-phosphate 1-epimerase
LTVTNTSDAPFRFEEALHTYFKVGQVQSVAVRGLDHAVYLDNTDGNRRKIQSGDVAFTSSTDSAFMNTQGPADVLDRALNRILRTEKGNSSTTIVWNPWQQGAASLKDLGMNEWNQMVCVEASNIVDFAISLAPGEQHTMRATISSHRL